MAESESPPPPPSIYCTEFTWSQQKMPTVNARKPPELYYPCATMHFPGEGSPCPEGQRHLFFRCIVRGWPLQFGVRFNHTQRKKEEDSHRYPLINMAAIYAKQCEEKFHPLTPPVVELAEFSPLYESLEYRSMGMITLHFTGAFEFPTHTQAQNVSVFSCYLHLRKMLFFFSVP